MQFCFKFIISVCCFIDQVKYVHQSFTAMSSEKVERSRKVAGEYSLQQHCLSGENLDVKQLRNRCARVTLTTIAPSQSESLDSRPML